MTDVQTVPRQSYQYERKPIKLQNRGSRYSHTLYDLDGNVLLDEHGNKLNVYTSNMKAAFEDGKLRLIRRMSDPGYTYFVTSNDQLERFEEEREYGSYRYNNVYHVYADEDVDWDSPTVKQLFIKHKKD